MRKIDRAWFSRLLEHPARKWSMSILKTQEHVWAILFNCNSQLMFMSSGCQMPVELR